MNRGHLDLLAAVFFFQAEDGIRDLTVTGVQTCALPISTSAGEMGRSGFARSGILGTLKLSSTDWSRVKETWERKIEQRWFVGAHSNIGGGYADNRRSEERRVGKECRARRGQ